MDGVVEHLPHVWLSMMSFTYGDPIVELYTEFTDQVSVTTTTNQFVHSRADLGVFYILVDASEPVRTLLQRHCEEVSHLCTSGHQTVDCVAMPTGFCQAVERFIARLG